MEKYKFFLLIPLILFFALLFIIPQQQDDIWWRLHYGDQILKTHKVPKINYDSFTDEHHKWVDHAYGFDILVSSINKIFKFKSLLIFHSILLFLIGFLILKTTSSLNILRNSLAALLLLSHNSLRPYLVGDIFIIFLVLLGLKFRNLKKIQWYYYLWVFLFFMLWANIHGSSVAGVLLGGALIFPYKCKLSFKNYIILTIISILALFSTPYGYQIPFTTIKYILGFYTFIPALEEWRHPSLFTSLIIIIFSILTVYKSRKLNLKDMVILGILLFYSFLSIRNVPVFVIVSILLTVKKPQIPHFSSSKPYFITGLTLLIFLLIKPFIFQPKINDRFYPKEILNQLKSDLKPKKQYNTFTLHRWGGATIFHFNGKLKVFIDARNDCYSPKTFMDYNTIIKIKHGWKNLLNYYNPDLIILPKEHQLSKHLDFGWKIITQTNDKIVFKNIKLKGI